MNFIERYFTSNEVLYDRAIDYLFGLHGKDVSLQKAFELLSVAAERGYYPANKIKTEVFQPDSPVFNSQFEQRYDSVCRLKHDEENGVPSACYAANINMLYNAYDRKQFEKAYEKIHYAARHKYPPAIFELANIYHHGIDVEKDEGLALRLLKEAASYGEKRALGTLYLIGEKELALKYSERFAAGGDDSDRFFYGKLLYHEERYDEAFVLLKPAADQGNGEAMHLLGLMYEHGDGCERDLFTAVSWYQASADTGYVPAYVCLANVYRLGPEGYRDEEAAFELYLRAANEGDPSDWNNVGHCYRYGVGVVKDEEKAIEAFKKGAKGENLGLAQYHISMTYLDRASAIHNEQLGLEWLKRAAADGCPPASWHLGCLYRDGVICEQNAGLAFHWLKTAADAGNYRGIVDVANLYISGFGVEKDEQKGFELLYDICDKDAEAMRILGNCYSRGIGCARNFPRAFRCYTLAAERGSLNAVYDIAVCYRYGEGVPQDFRKAIEHYEIAIEQGHAAAMSNCGILYEVGMGVERDIDKAFELYSRAAELGNYQGQFLLGKLYFDGRGVERDYCEAVKWFIEAARAGEPDALFHLGLCYFEGLGVEQDSFLAVKCLYESADRDWQPAIDFIIKNHIPRPDTCE